MVRDPGPMPVVVGTSLRRREWLQLGFSSLLGLNMVAGATGGAPQGEWRPRRARSVLLVFLTGGPGHLDSFDPKPEAPESIRGGLGAISTSLAGVQFSELLPELARRADRFALVRTMAFAPGLAVHELATPLILAGRDTLPPGVGLAASRNDWPCYAAGLAASCPEPRDRPAGITLPNGLGAYAGQNAGLLGPRFDPWRPELNRASPDLDSDRFGIASAPGVARVSTRGELLAALETSPPWVSRAFEQMESQRTDALRLLADRRLGRAFQLRDEDPKLRDRYGRHVFGQSLLLARRFVELGVPLVQVNMGVTAQWDFHSSHEAHSRRLFPPLDRAVSALLDDLEATGALEETFVVMLGEFGRTPLINKDAGRDHWTEAFSALFAGAGVRGGLVLGKTDRNAAQPLTRTYSPADLGATIYSMLGVEPEQEFTDVSGRRHRLNEGRPIAELFEGTA